MLEIVFLLQAVNFRLIAIDPFQPVPFVSTWLKNDFKAHRQNWTIDQGTDGLIYFANNAGLLEYDGARWELHTMPGKLGLRAVATASDGRIYTGSYEEFGFWERQADGTLTYNSLSAKLQNYRFNNDEIWRIVIAGQKVFFQAFGNYFVYDGSQVVHYPTPEAVLFFLAAGDEVYVQGMNSGLYKLVDDSLAFVYGSEGLKGSLIRSAILLADGTILFATASRGLFRYDKTTGTFSRWNTKADMLLTQGQVNSGTLTHDSVLCYGTIGAGIVAIDLEGNYLWQFRKDQGLPTNTVLYLFTDRQNNVWAALDKGIAKIELSSPFRYVTMQADNIELVYTATEFNGSLYIGTNQGVFVQNPGKSNRFRFIEGTQGQVWQLKSFNGQLLCGHNEGTFRIEGSRAVKISGITGGTALQTIVSNNRDYLIQSSYGPLVVYTRDPAGLWKFSHTITGFSHPVRFIEVDHQGYIWASHFIKGVYRIRLNELLTRAEEITGFGSAEGLPDHSKINVCKLSNRVVFCTGNSFYTYDDLTGKIVAFDWLNRLTGEFASSHLIQQAGPSQYWLVNHNKFARIQIADDSVQFMEVVPFSLLRHNLIDGNESVTTLSDSTYLFCLENGLASYNPKWLRHTDPRPVLLVIRQVTASSGNRNLLLQTRSDKSNPVQIPFKYRRIAFTLAYPDFTGKEVSIRCRFENRKKILADTLADRFETQTFANTGHHLFVAKVFDDQDRLIDSQEYAFVILPPFYASIWAIGVYVLVFFAAALATRQWLRLHVLQQKEKVRMEQEKLQLEKLEKREQKIIRLKNEKLEAELLHKSKELASTTMSIVRKNEILLQLRKEVENQKLRLGSQYPNKYADRLLTLINENIESDHDWEIFQQNFDLIHENFFRNLHERYPGITVHDLKLCAFIRLNLSTKEIASLLNVTVRGVEAARYRLRKKFALPPEKNLTEYLIEFR